MEWIYKHLVEVTVGGTIGTIVIVAVYFRKAIARLWWSLEKIHETDQRVVAGFQDLTSLTDRQLAEARRECEALKAEAKELRRDLADQIRAVGLRDEINRQDRALVRALKGRMRENRIDFADIDESIQRQFGNEP